MGKVGRLALRTSIVAPGLARTYLLTSVPRGTLLRYQAGASLLGLTRSITLQLRGGTSRPRSIIVANIGYHSRGRPIVCGVTTATGRVCQRRSPFFSQDFSKAKSLFTSMLYNYHAGNVYARSTVLLTKGFLSRDVISAVGRGAPKHSNIGFRGFLVSLVTSSGIWGQGAQGEVSRLVGPCSEGGRLL